MLELKNEYGTIRITDHYLANLLSKAVSNCFGVVGLAVSGPSQGLRNLIGKGNSPDRGIRIRTENGALFVDVHIVVTYGLNIQEIVKSIINRVSFTVEQATGQIVQQVHVYVDGLEA